MHWRHGKQRRQQRTGSPSRQQRCIDSVLPSPAADRPPPGLPPRLIKQRMPHAGCKHPQQDRGED
jgi:hypothetical protein